jgi:hypothetical protein
MAFAFDPLISISVLFFQIGSRYLKFDITKTQAKILHHPYTQLILYASIVYYSTRSVVNTIIVVVMTYLFIYILFNENNEYNILPSKLLYEENISNTLVSYRENYKKNFERLHS